jgi:hypothetical protein
MRPRSKQSQQPLDNGAAEGYKRPLGAFHGIVHDEQIKVLQLGGARVKPSVERRTASSGYPGNDYDAESAQIVHSPAFRIRRTAA